MTIFNCATCSISLLFLVLLGCESIENSEPLSASATNDLGAETNTAWNRPPQTRLATVPADTPAATNQHSNTPGSNVPNTTAPAQNSDSGTASQSEQQALEDRLLGTWVATDVDSEIGEVKIRLTFRDEGPVKIAAWSELPFVGQVRDKTAPYEVQGHTITSDVLRGGTTVQYWFDQGDLIIQYEDGKTVRFQRQSQLG